MKNHIKKITLCALFASITFVATMFISIPTGVGNINLGDAFILCATFLLGPIYGAIAGATGAMLADLPFYTLYAPATFIIKGAMSLIGYLIFTLIFKLTHKDLPSMIVGGVVAEIIMVLGYFFYEWIFVLDNAYSALLNVPFNLIQGFSGILVGVIITKLLKSNKYIKNYLSE